MASGNELNLPQELIRATGRCFRVSLKRRARAIFIGPSALDALKPGATGRVHSVFERTFNILIGGKLVGIARADAAKSPINLITDITPDTPVSSLVRKGAKASVAGDVLQVGDELTIYLKNAEVWKPRNRVTMALEIKVIENNLEVAKRLASNRSESLGQLLPHIDEISSGVALPELELNQVAKAVLPHVVSLVSAVRSEDLDGVKQSSENLLGLGPGLSPSADDMLVGFMAGLQWTVDSLGGDIDRVDVINRTITARAAEKTTLLSQQLLRHAARGEVNETVQLLLEAILAGTPADVESATKEVLTIGETSGVDMMVGILIGMHLGLNMLR